MWEEIESARMETGIGTVDSQSRRFVFGAATVRLYGLDRFATVTPANKAESPSLISFHFFENGEGKRRLVRARPGEKTMSVNCQPVLAKAGALPGRYRMRKLNNSFIIVDTLRGKPDQFSPRKGG